MNANKRRTGRTRKKERGEAGAELQDAAAEQKASEPEVEGPVKADDDKEKEEETKAELKSSQPEGQGVETAHPEPRKQSEQVYADQPETGQKSGGKRVADNREGVFDSFTKMNESVFSFEGVKKAAAWYIETSEKLANQALELQEKATGWAKDTPLAPLFEAQHSIARKFVERSASAARTLWQIQPSQ